MPSFYGDLIVVIITFFYLSLCSPDISLSCPSDKQVPEGTELNSSLGSIVEGSWELIMETA